MCWPRDAGDWATFFLALLLIPVLLLEETSSDPGVVQLATVTNALIWLAFALDYAIDVWRAIGARHTSGATGSISRSSTSRHRCSCRPAAQVLRALRALRLLRAIAVVGIILERLGRPLSRDAALVLAAMLAIVVIVGGLSSSSSNPRHFARCRRAMPGSGHV
jgi:hypothetical protein